MQSCPSQAASFSSLCEQMETDPGNRRWSNYWNSSSGAPQSESGCGFTSGGLPCCKITRGAVIIFCPSWTVIKQAQCDRSGWTVSLVDQTPTALLLLSDNHSLEKSNTVSTCVLAYICVHFGKLAA